MAGPFYFRWSDSGDLPWDPSYAVEDEDIFSFDITHSEGDFPVMEVLIRNPRVGLLASSRQQWAWLSYDKPGEGIIPLFFGRILGVPQSIQNDMIRVTFVARPSDFEEQKEDLAETLRVLPYFDPIWILEDERGDPDRVLEARTELWHIDRVTHEVTVSDIIVGDDDPVPVVPDTELFYDSLEVSYSTSPARKVIFDAEIGWNQRGSGVLDLQQEIIQAFAEMTPSSVSGFTGGEFSTSGQIVTFGGDSLVNSWPEPGRRIGGGWSVEDSELTLIGQPPLNAISYSQEVYERIKSANPALGGKNAKVEGIFQSIRDVVARAPGYAVQVVAHTIDEEGQEATQIDIVWLPVWRMAPIFSARWEANRQRTETIHFEMLADVQPLLADPGDEEIVQIALGPAYVDDVIPNVLGRSYFKTARGKQSVENLLARARAVLLARARAIDVTFASSLDFGTDITCRRSLAVQDDRLPAGQVSGKVKSYRLVVDGDSGEMYSTVTLGCTVGRDGSVTPEDGEPTYVADGYVNTGYQVYAGSVTVMVAGDVAYSGIDETGIDDDGMDLLNVTNLSHVIDVGASGGLNTQEARLNVETTSPNTLYVVDQVNSITVTIWAEMLPVTGGPFLTHFVPEVTELKVPRTIDLEEENT